MRWKSMFITIILNIFVMLAVSILLEYVNLSERFISLEDSVQEALDMSIESAVMSEEFFTDYYQSLVTSNATSSSYIKSACTTTFWLESDSVFTQLNTYALAKYYEDNGRLPVTTYECSTATSSLSSTGSNIGIENVYEWLYGSSGSDYNDSALTWANKSTSRKREYSNYTSSRGDDVNSNFEDFVSGVGKYQLTSGFLKTKTGSNSYSLNVTTYPTLCNMGLKGLSSLLSSYNSVTNTVTADNFTSSVHIGKSRLGNTKTKYYLTPMSLGVTYIPTEVLKPVFIANLDTLVRLNLLGGSSISNTVSGDAKSALAQASYCMETSVYDTNSETNSSLDATKHASHTASSSSEDIVTDGLVEYDLSTVKVKVDYFYINYSTYDHTYGAKIISKINGAVQAYGESNTGKTGNPNGVADDETTSRDNTLDRYFDQDSSAYLTNTSLLNAYDDVRYGRIIARVTVKLKVHVPYQSSLLQWMCSLSRLGRSTHHYDIKLWNELTNTAETSSDGIWYQYTTYFCQSRS